jgi:hypothetical protein
LGCNTRPILEVCAALDPTSACVSVDEESSPAATDYTPFMTTDSKSASYLRAAAARDLTATFYTFTTESEMWTSIGTSIKIGIKMGISMSTRTSIGIDIGIDIGMSIGRGIGKSISACKNLLIIEAAPAPEACPDEHQPTC